jgi:large subunit ribosomal protein L10
VKRAEKIAAVEDLSARFRDAPNVILTAFSGLTVLEATELRRRIREAGGAYRVIKNRLAKRAAAGTPAEKLGELLTGPRAIAFHESDPLAISKVLTEYAADHPQLKVVGGVIDAKDVVDPQAVKALATLPSLPELRAQLLALISTPATSLARIIATPATQIAGVVKARNDKMEAEG